jgi:hypothetical protein
MDVSRMSQGQQIAAAGGALLIICLFLPWFGDLSGWEGQSSTDIYLLITAVVAITAALGYGFAGNLPGVSPNGATALLGIVALVLVLWLVIFDFPEGADRGIGILLSIVATAAIAYGGYTSAE